MNRDILKRLEHLESMKFNTDKVILIFGDGHREITNFNDAEEKLILQTDFSEDDSQKRWIVVPHEKQIIDVIGADGETTADCLEWLQGIIEINKQALPYGSEHPKGVINREDTDNL